jgi:ATP-binding cassette, subfamily C, bacterial
MRQLFKIFFRTEGTRPWLVLAALVAGGILESLSIGTLLPVLNALTSSQNPTTPFLENTIRGVVQSMGLTPALGTLVLLMLLIFSVRSIALFAAMSYAANASAQVTINFRRKVIHTLFNARWSYFSSQSGGEIANAMGLNATQAGSAFQFAAESIAVMIQIIAYSTLALLVNPAIAAAGAVGGAVIGTFSYWVIRTTRHHANKQTDRTTMLSTDMIDLLQNIKPLKAMQRFDPLIGRLERRLVKIRRNARTVGYSKFGMSYGNDLLLAFIVCAGAYAARVYGGISLAELTVFGILFFQLVSYVARLQKVLQIVSVYERSYTAMHELVGAAVAAAEVNVGTQAPALKDGCSLEKVSFAHGDQIILKDVSLRVPAGEITVLQGPSGSGKTTIIDLITGFHQPGDGVVRIGSDDLRAIDVKAWRHRIGYVPQELILFHDSIRENISLADPDISDAAVEAAMETAGLAEFVGKLPEGPDTDVGEYGSRLSGGQRQRISLARALVHKPDVLILDEVTSALDPETERAIVTSIAALRGRYTIIAITHRPAWAGIADRIYEVSDGGVREAPMQPAGKHVRNA